MNLNEIFDSKKIDWEEYERRVQELEDQGVSRSDAQGIVDAEMLQQPLDEKQDACYRKVKSRYKVWPSAYASGALVQCRKKGAANWGNKSESTQQPERYAIKHRKSGRILSLQEDLAAIEDEYKKLSSLKEQFVVVRSSNPNVDWRIDENLRKWFREKWVRFGPDGKIRGACARGSESEGKPKCLPQSKAHALGKKGRASAAAKKRREDPNPERRGKARNVATKVREQGVTEGGKVLTPGEKQSRTVKSPVSVSNDQIKTFAYNGHVIKYSPDTVEISYNNQPVYKKHGNYANPSRATHSSMKGVVDTMLRKKRRGISEQDLAEVSRDTLASYVTKASDARGHKNLSTAKLDQRHTGIAKAVKRLDQKNNELNEISAIDKLEQRRIDDLNDKMDGVIARISRERITDPDVIALLMKQYDKYKSERDSYYRVRESKKKVTVKQRDPNYATLTAKRTSGASGQHVDKKRQQELGKAKHKLRDLDLDLAEAQKPKTVAKLAPAIKLFQATIRVKMPDYTGLMDVNVTAPNINMARQMVKAMYSIQNNNVINVKEVKALKEGWSDKYNPTPYGVYIDGKQWKEFTSDEHARAVADKVRASLAAQGRKQTVTIAPAESYLKKKVDEEWSEKYKRSINCNNPKGFSQKAHCAGRKKNEDVENSQVPFDQKLQRLKVQARREFPNASSDDEALLLKVLAKQTKDEKDNAKVDKTQDELIYKNFATDLDQESEISRLQKALKDQIGTLKEATLEKDETDLQPGEYYIWKIYFDDGTDKRIKVTSDDFDPYEYYQQRGRTVVNIDFNWDKHS